MKTIEELGLNGIKIYQDDNLYRFTSDAILLSRFAKVKRGEVVADFCSGSGIVGLHLYALNPFIKKVVMFEMQKPLADLSEESIKLNDLQNVFSLQNVKVQDIPSNFYGTFSLIVVNPPYAPVGVGETSKDNSIAICKSEVALKLNELIEKVAKCLKFGGKFCMVHRADRLTDIILEMKKNNLEPKRLQFVSGAKKDPYLLLIEGVKGGKKGGLKVLKEIEN